MKPALPARWLVLSALLSSILLASCGDRPTTTKPPPAKPSQPIAAPSSPKALHTRIQAAVTDNQMGELVRLHAPADRPLFIVNLVVVANLASRGESAHETLRSLLRRHGVSHGGTAPQDLAARRVWAARWLDGVDMVALGGDLAFFCGPDLRKRYTGPLSGLAINGSTADAKIGGWSHRFKQVGGHWYLDAEGR